MVNEPGHLEWTSANDIPIGLVLDLPQIHQKPSGTDLIKVLALLTLQPRTFGTSTERPKSAAVQPAGVTRYLTSIISSPLSWLDTEELREAIWDNASARLSERSGRTGKAAPQAWRVKSQYCLLT